MRLQYGGKNRLQSYQVYQLPCFGWKHFELNRRMSPDSANFLFFQYDFVVGFSGLDKDLDQWVFHPLLFNLMSISLTT